MADIDVSLQLGAEAQLNAAADLVDRIATTLREINALDQKQERTGEQKERTLSAQAVLQKRLNEIEKEKERAGLAALKYLQAQEKEAAKIAGKRISDEKAKERALERVRKEQERLNQKLREENSIIGQINSQINKQKQLLREAINVSQIEKANRELVRLKGELRQVQQIGLETRKSGSFFGSIFGGSFFGNVAANALSAAFSSAQDAARTILRLAADREAAVAKLTRAFEGDQRLAINTVKDIENFAARANFGVEELTAGTLRLANRGLRPTQQLMTQIADLANALSTRADGFTQVTEALLDAQVGQFRRLEELGVAIDANTLKSANKIIATFKGVNTVIEKTPDAITKYILSLSQLNSVQGATADINETLAGKLEQTADALDKIFRNLGTAKVGLLKSFFGALAEGLDQVADGIEVLFRSSEAIDKIAKNEVVKSFVDKKVNSFQSGGSFLRNAIVKNLVDDLNQFTGELNSARELLTESQDGRNIGRFGGSVASVREFQENITADIRRLELLVQQRREALDAINSLNNQRKPDDPIKVEKAKKEDLSYLRQRKELFGSINRLESVGGGSRLVQLEKLILAEEKLNAELQKPVFDQNVETIKALRAEIERIAELVKIDTTPLKDLLREIEKRTANPSNPAGGGGLGNLGDRARTLQNLGIRQTPLQGPQSLQEYFDLITGTFVNEFPKYQEQFQQFVDFLDQRDEVRTQRKLDRIDRETEKQRSAVDTQRDLAARGLENTLAFELERQQKLEQLRAREEERARRRALRYAALQALLSNLGNIANAAQSGQPLNFAQIFGSLTAATPGFFEKGGVVGEAEFVRAPGGQVVRGVAQGRSHSQGGILAEFEGGEGILSRKHMEKMGYENFMQLRAALDGGTYADFLSGSNVQFTTVMQQSDGSDKVVRSIESLREEIRNIKTTHISVDDLGNIVETEIENGMQKKTTYVKTPPRGKW